MDTCGKAVRLKVKIIASRFIFPFFSPPPSIFSWKSSRAAQMGRAQKGAHLGAVCNRNPTSSGCPTEVGIAAPDPHPSDTTPGAGRHRAGAKPLKEQRARALVMPALLFPEIHCLLCQRKSLIANAFFNTSAKYRTAVNSVINSPGGRGLAGGGRGNAAVTQQRQQRGCPTFKGNFSANFVVSLVRHAPARDWQSGRTPPLPPEKVGNPRDPLRQPRAETSRSLADSVPAPSSYKAAA